MGLFKLMSLPLRIMMWPMAAPVRMMMMPLKMALRFLTVMLLFAKLMAILFAAAMFVMFALFFVKKKMRMGKMGMHGRMHMHMPTSRRFKP